MPLELPDLAFHSHDFLNVMADFMRQDVGLSKFTGRAKAAFEFVVKTKIDVDLFVSRAVKRAGSGFGAAARSGIGVIAEEYEFGMTLGSTRLLRAHLIPGLLRVVENEGDKLHQRFFRGVAGGIGRAHRRRTRARSSAST